MSVNYQSPPTMPAPHGYSQVVAWTGSGSLVFVSGQVAENAQGQAVGVGDLQAQTRQVFENLKAALEAAGGSLAHLIKLTTYLTNIDCLALVRQVREEYVNPAAPPASTTVQVARLDDDRWLIEIDAIAIIPT